MEFSLDFFRDEVRCGFYIPTAVKQAWAAELSVLSEIDRICEKHGIRYFADWGSILGAVRHGGFVPWDDDLDICMLRDDYIRFRQVADAELPEEYVIHDYERQKDHWLFLARVVNHDKICFEPGYLNSHYNFPWLAGVDIFVKDYLYEDPEKEKERDDEVMHILAVADGIVGGTLSREAAERWLDGFEARYGVRLERNAAARQMGIALYRLAEQQMVRVPAAETDIVGQIFPFILKGGKGQPKKYYEETIRLPFENMTIPVPASYDTILKSRYGDYLHIRKVWGGHGYPFFEGQRKELQSHADFQLPEYSFDRSVLKPRDRSVWEANAQQERLVLFLAAGPMWWGSFSEYYQRECAQPDTQVYVVALPMLFKNCYGEIVATDEELAAAAREAEYPEEIMMIPWYDVDLEQALPDKVYIQDAYDGENPCLTIPPVFYASEVRRYTKELILVPALAADDFTPEDRNDVYGMKHYVTAPGVVFADKVLLCLAGIRERYLEKLLSWAEEDTEEYWKQKLQIAETDAGSEAGNSTGSGNNTEEKKSFRNGNTVPNKKKLLFVIGANEMAEYHEEVIALLESRFQVFVENREHIDLVVCLYPVELHAWTEVSEEQTKNIWELVEKYAAQEWCTVYGQDEFSPEEATAASDAYYGSASPLVLHFVRAKKPVMIADYHMEVS